MHYSSIDTLDTKKSLQIVTALFGYVVAYFGAHSTSTNEHGSHFEHSISELFDLSRPERLGTIALLIVKQFSASRQVWPAPFGLPGTSLRVRFFYIYARLGSTTGI